MVELQQLLIEAEDPYFELRNGGLRAIKRLFELEGLLAQPRFRFAKLDMVDGQLHEKNGSCATGDSIVMTRAVNKLKRRSKTDEVALLQFQIDPKTSLDELARPLVELQELLIEADDS